MPEQNTAPSASSQGWPIPLTTPKVKKALRPMPGAIATGQFAHRPMIAVPMKAAKIVAVKTAPKSMPASLRIKGLTTMM